jgi:hypothetical protein
VWPWTILPPLYRTTTLRVDSGVTLTHVRNHRARPVRGQRIVIHAVVATGVAWPRETSPEN